MDTAMKDIRIKLPEAELVYLKALANSKGWKIEPYTQDEETTSERMLDKHSLDRSFVSPTVKELTGIASAITQEQIMSDPRLAYLMGI